MTKAQIMTAEVKKHAAKKKYIHEVWLNRQADFRKIKEQDCYGYSKDIANRRQNTLPVMEGPKTDGV